MAASEIRKLERRLRDCPDSCRRRIALATIHVCQAFPEPHAQVAGRKNVTLIDAHRRSWSLIVAFCPARHLAGSFANRQ